MTRVSLLLLASCLAIVATMTAACGDDGSAPAGDDTSAIGGDTSDATATDDDGQASDDPDVVVATDAGPDAAADPPETGDDPGAPVDILFVVDTSTSFCGAQTRLVRSAKEFAAALSDGEALDPRIAVTSRDMGCEKVAGATSSQGRFNVKAATTMPPSCGERQVRACTSDDQCSGIDCSVYGNCFEPGEWRCFHISNLSGACLSNPNGSINSFCRRTCTEDDECQAILGDDGYCQKPSDDQADWNCQVRLPTTQCPTSLPAFVDASNLDVLPCLLAVGINQLNCAGPNSALAAAWAALDPAGPNAEQASAFRRPDVPLVIAFLSDEDDCSADGPISEDMHTRCAVIDLLEDPSTAGGPLTDIAGFVDDYRSLATDPADVHVVAMAGDFRPFRTDEAAASASQCPTCAATAAAGCTPEYTGFGWEATCPGDDVCVSADGDPLESSAIAEPHPICQCLSEQGVPFDPDSYDDLAHQACIRDRFVQSTLSPEHCYSNTSICETTQLGQAKWGRRFQQLVEGFGDTGLFLNYCGDGGVENALDEIAEVVQNAVASD